MCAGMAAFRRFSLPDYVALAVRHVGGRADRTHTEPPSAAGSRKGSPTPARRRRFADRREASGAGRSAHRSAGRNRRPGHCRLAASSSSRTMPFLSPPMWHNSSMYVNSRRLILAERVGFGSLHDICRRCQPHTGSVESNRSSISAVVRRDSCRISRCWPPTRLGSERPAASTRPPCKSKSGTRNSCLVPRVVEQVNQTRRLKAAPPSPTIRRVTCNPPALALSEPSALNSSPEPLPNTRCQLAKEVP
jgi:hypothetical protein